MQTQIIAQVFISNKVIRRVGEDKIDKKVLGSFEDTCKAFNTLHHLDAKILKVEREPGSEGDRFVCTVGWDNTKSTNYFVFQTLY
jgi:hypothetical protein